MAYTCNINAITRDHAQLPSGLEITISLVGNKYPEPNAFGYMLAAIKIEEEINEYCIEQKWPTSTWTVEYKLSDVKYIQVWFSSLEQVVLFRLGYPHL